MIISSNNDTSHSTRGHDPARNDPKANSDQYTILWPAQSNYCMWEGCLQITASMEIFTKAGNQAEANGIL